MQADVVMVTVKVTLSVTVFSDSEHGGLLAPDRLI